MAAVEKRVITTKVHGPWTLINGKDSCIKWAYILTIEINPEPTMTQNRYPSRIPSSIPNEDVDEDSSTESDVSGAEWSGPENQLGLEPDDQAVGLDKKGDIRHHETIAIYWDLPRQRDPSRRSQKRDGYKHQYQAVIGKSKKGEISLHCQNRSLIEDVRKKRM